jgi:hypothetical protein
MSSSVSPSPPLPTSHDHCNQIFWNAIELIHRSGDIDALSLMHNIGQTTRCDNFKDMSPLRTRYREKMGPETYDKVVNINTPLQDDDLRRMHVTVGYYIRWTREEFVSALPWDGYLKYNLFYFPVFNYTPEHL